MCTSWAGVVLAGGRGSRLGGVDKATLRIGDDTLLERALDALDGAEPVVVVAPTALTTRSVEVTLEQPPGGGPAAGLLSAVDLIGTRAEVVVVLAVDMPWVAPATVARLLAATTPDVDGAVLDDGHLQHLAAAYRTTRLREVAPPVAERHGLSVRRLVASLVLAPVPAIDGEGRDVDVPADLPRLRE